jgi:hypothetical protein
MSAIKVGSETRRRLGVGLLHFPGNHLVGDPRLEGVAAKAIWLVIPFEYYVLTRFSGGLDVTSYVPAAAMALICVVTIMAVSALISVVPWNGRYADRFRGWTVALLTIWGTSLTLLALSYFFARLHCSGCRDFIGEFVFVHWGGAGYPGVRWQTFLAYSGYSLLAAVIVSVAIYALPLPKQKEIETDAPPAANEAIGASQDQIAEPNIILVAIIVAALMMYLHRASTVTSLPMTIF